jgi:hypothetical protein
VQRPVAQIDVARASPSVSPSRSPLVAISPITVANAAPCSSGVSALAAAMSAVISCGE